MWTHILWALLIIHLCLVLKSTYSWQLTTDIIYVTIFKVVIIFGFVSKVKGIVCIDLIRQVCLLNEITECLGIHVFDHVDAFIILLVHVLSFILSYRFNLLTDIFNLFLIILKPSINIIIFSWVRFIIKNYIYNKKLNFS